MGNTESTIPTETKKPWQSKTNWVALLMAVVAFIQPAQDWIAHNPMVFTQVTAAVFIALRMVTKGKISID